MTIRVLALLAPVLTLAVAAPAPASEISKNVHESFDVQEGDRLHLEHGDGDVSITPWDRDTLDVAVRYRAEMTRIGLGSDADFEVEFRRSGNTVYVIGRETGGFNIGFSISRRHEYTYTILAPAYLALELEGDDGDVQLENWRGDVSSVLGDGDIVLSSILSDKTTVTLEDGDLVADGLRGEVSVQSDDGDVSLSDCQPGSARIRLEDGDLTAKRCQGDFDIRSDDGDVALLEQRGGTIKVRTADGNVELSLAESSKSDLDIATDDGRVNVELERGASVRYEIQTDDGRIRLDLSEAGELSRDKHRASGKIRGGAGQVRIKTSDGSVTLRESSLPED